HSRLGISELKRMGVVLKRARYFIRAADWPAGGRPDREATVRALIDPKIYSFGMEQLSLFQEAPSIRPLPTGRDVKTISEAVEETVLCLTSSL
ncbi:MAG: biotin synthase, partial [Christensenellales bacterium]